MYYIHSCMGRWLTNSVISYIYCITSRRYKVLSVSLSCDRSFFTSKSSFLDYFSRPVKPALND